MSISSLFISNAISVAFLPIFLVLLIKKYKKVKKFERIEIFLTVILSLITVGLGNIIFLCSDIFLNINLAEVNIVLAKIDLFFYFITLTFLFNFFILQAYKTNLKSSVVARVIVTGILTFAIITIILIPMNPITFSIDFSIPLVQIFLIVGFFITFFLSIAFTYGLIRKLRTQLEVTNELDMSTTLLVIGFWIFVFGTVITYILISHELANLIYSIGCYIFIIGYWMHEPFKDIVESFLERRIEEVGTFNNQEFYTKFGFYNPKNANLLLLQSNNIEKQNFISNLVNFLNTFKVPCIILSPKGGTNKFLNNFSRSLDDSNMTIFEYCVDPDFEEKSDGNCIMVSIDLSLLYEAIKTTAISFKNENFYLIVDSLTDLITWHGFKKLYIFLKKTTDILKDHNCLSIFTLNPEAHEQSQVESIKIIMDGILETKEKKYILKEF